jgi:hypothetical protein
MTGVPNPQAATSTWRGTDSTRRQNLKNFLVCFSIGNMCFIRRWYDLENLQAHSVDYYRTAPVNPTLLSATVVAGLLLSVALWLAWRWLERHATPARVRVAQCVFLLLLVFPLESVRRYWNLEREHPDIASNVALLVVEAILAIGAMMALAGKPRVAYSARRMLVPLVFLYPALILDFVWSQVAAEPESAYQAKASLAPLPPRPGGQHRIIWIVFDELDQRIAFDARPKNVDLPELDRLRGESLVARHAIQTAPWTVIALPSLLCGRVFSRAELIDADELRLTPENSTQSLNWSDQPNVFRRARQLGANASMVGWHHPYCRVLGDSLVNCFALPSGHPTAALLRETHASEEGVWRTVAFLFRLQFENLRDLVRWNSSKRSEDLRSAYVQQRQQQQYFRIRDRVYAGALDRQIEFLFAHFPTPHLFGIYDRARCDFTLNAHEDYLDNLALVDRTLGELRQELEREGLWDSTTVLLTSDHGLRPDLWKGRYGWNQQMEELTVGGRSETVPFLLKLAGQREPVEFDKPFSGVVSGDLCLAVLSGEVRTPREAAAWLDAHASHPTGILSPKSDR